MANHAKLRTEGEQNGAKQLAASCGNLLLSSGLRRLRQDLVNFISRLEGSKAHGIEPGEYSRVESVNAKENLLTVKRESVEQISYDPRRLQGVTLYRETGVPSPRATECNSPRRTGSSTLRIVSWEPSRESKRTPICNCARIQVGVSHST
ncbi:MAG: hypothetical protein WA639_18800 [Candidatus Acidiferrum sp.]